MAIKIIGLITAACAVLLFSLYEQKKCPPAIAGGRFLKSLTEFAPPQRRK